MYNNNYCFRCGLISAAQPNDFDGLFLCHYITMAGGIFTNRPFEPNTKCIIFSFIIMGICVGVNRYGFNNYLLPLVFVISYVAMAWYDYMYECGSQMYTGSVGLTGPIDSLFKPQRRDDLAPNQEMIYRRNLYIFHIIALGFVTYIGAMTLKGTPVNNGLYGAMTGITGMGLLYHIGRLIVPRRGC